MKFRPFLTSLLAGLLLACSATSGILGPTATPEPTATPTLLAKPGHWEGAPEVSFDVNADGTVSNFTILIGGDCRVQVNTPQEIRADNLLVIGAISPEGMPVDNGILGTFESDISIQGTVASPYVCGGGAVVTTFYLPDALTSWSAEWVGP